MSTSTLERRFFCTKSKQAVQEGMNSKSLPLAADPGVAKAASALADDIPFKVRQRAVFLGVSSQENDERGSVPGQKP